MLIKSQTSDSKVQPTAWQTSTIKSDKQLNESQDILNEMQSYTDQLESPVLREDNNSPFVSPDNAVRMATHLGNL